jgi:hypothetical protein
MFLQQGDVLLRSVDSIPKNATQVKRSSKGWVLAEGETTGHAHRIDSDVMLVEHDGKLFMHNDHEVVLTHEEHNNFIVPPGDWSIGIVQEYDHFAEEARNVAD